MKFSSAFITLVVAASAIAAPLPAQEVERGEIAAETDILYTKNNWVFDPPSDKRNEAATTDSQYGSVNWTRRAIRAIKRAILAPDTDRLEVCPYWCPGQQIKDRSTDTADTDLVDITSVWHQEQVPGKD